MSEVAVPERDLPGPLTRARFLLLSDLPDRAARPGAPTVPHRVTWRLVAANNRPLGQAGQLFGSAAGCIDNIELLLSSIADVVSAVHFHLDTTSNAASAGPTSPPRDAASIHSHWSWIVSVADAVLAVSAHQYRRRIECDRSLAQFLTAVRARPPAPRPDQLRRLGARLGSVVR